MVDYAAEIERMKRESGMLAAIYQVEVDEHRRVNREFQEIMREAIDVMNEPLIQLCDDIRRSMKDGNRAFELRIALGVTYAIQLPPGNMGYD